MSGLPPIADRNFLAKLREFALIARGLAGDPLDSFVTLRDLKKADIINVRQLGGAASGGAGGSGSKPRPVVEPAVDMTPPPAPGGFAATSGITQILFETAAPVYRQGHGHARTKVYAAPVTGGPLPTFADAVLYTDFPGNIGVAPFDPASSLRLWATWTSVDGVESEPAGGTNGIAAATGLLENQHIANLAVGKLLAGSLSVGQYIQSADYVASTSGWRIQTLGGGGAFMEINGGAIIGGATIGADFIRSNNFVLNSAGWRLKADGTGQIGAFAVTNDGIQSTNYVLNTSGWKLKNDGTGQIGGFVIGSTFIRSTNYVAGTSGWNIPNGAGTAQFSDVLLTGGVIRNSTDSGNLNLSATGAALLFRAGASHNYGAYAGTHYPVEIYADGRMFLGKNLQSGGEALASSGGTPYTIPLIERPAVIFQLTPDAQIGGA